MHLLQAENAKYVTNEILIRFIRVGNKGQCA